MLLQHGNLDICNVRVCTRTVLNYCNLKGNTSHTYIRVIPWYSYHRLVVRIALYTLSTSFFRKRVRDTSELRKEESFITLKLAAHDS